MDLSASERAFIKRRRRLTQTWKYAGTGLIIILTMLAVYLYLSVPWMMNPWHTLAKIDQGLMAETTLVTMAVLMPVIIWCLLGVVLIVILYGFAIFSNERKYLAILDRMMRQE